MVASVQITLNGLPIRQGEVEVSVFHSGHSEHEITDVQGNWVLSDDFCTFKSRLYDVAFEKKELFDRNPLDTPETN